MATEQHTFVLGSEPCDICQSMEGTYAYAPTLPVHPNCDCQAHAHGGDSNCSTEIRNVHCQTSTSTETRPVKDLTIPGVLAEDADFPLTISLGVLHQSWDDQRLESACNWSPPGDTFETTVTLPAGLGGDITISVEMMIEEVIATGELWEVSRRPAPPGGFAHTLKERLLSRVGGSAMAVTGLGDVSID